jgi:O-antigen ligase
MHIGRGNRVKKGLLPSFSRVPEVPPLPLPLIAALYLVLPVAGLIAGPLYAPAVFGVAVIGVLWIAIRERARVALDRPLALLALGFVALAWAGLGWSVSPHRTLSGAVQVSLVLPACLVFLSVCRKMAAERAHSLAAFMGVAFVAGMLVILSDRLDGYRLLRLIDGQGVWPTKYNRGLDYFALILLPTIGTNFAQRRWGRVAGLGVVAAIAVAAGHNTTAQLALPIAACVIGAGMLAPRAMFIVLAAATALEALALPFAIRVITRFRPEIAPHIKLSGIERLEIWDYLSVHVLQRPLLGWGLWTAKLLPATPEERAHFIKATGSGIYPHNQWLELWLETGLPGVLLGLGFALLVLRRAARLPAALRPFGYGTFVLAMAVASSGFEVTTDSWWAALAASAGLFGLFSRVPTPHISRAAILRARRPHPDTIHLPAGGPEPRRNRLGSRTRVPGGR